MMLAAANEGTAPVRDAHRFDEHELARWMAEHVPRYSGPLTVEQFKGGQSNPTYKLMTPSGTYVLRRRPPGLLLKGAHAVEREAQVLTALRAVDFPVPDVLALCLDNDVIGTAFYVMAMVEGRIFWDATLPEVAVDERAAIFDAMNATMARLHSINYQAIGLGDFGRPGNYFERQIARWSRQYREDTDAGNDEFMDRMVEWLPANIPESEETSIVHGDFRIDNLIFHPTEPRVLAILDWELSTLGSPLADFSYHTMMYHMPPHIVAGLAGANVEMLGLPSEADYVRAYCERTGRTGIKNYQFYIAFNFFRMAAIFHGIKGRVIRGTASSATAADRAEAFPQLARIAWNHAHDAGSGTQSATQTPKVGLESSPRSKGN